jgi:integrase
VAIKLALTTGIRRGEVYALRWSDLNDDGTITVSHAFGNSEVGF